MERWGIIYCPKQGIRRTHKRWEHIRELLTERGVDYDFVQSEGLYSVKRLTQMLCKNGYTSIVIVGGDSALNQALNGVIELGDDIRQQVTIGIIPNGRGNDYAGFWGLEESNDEHSVEALLKRRTRWVDVGVCTLPDMQDKAERKDNNDAHTTYYFLNCVQIGLVANIMNLKYKTRRILGFSVLSYLSSMFLMIFQRREWRMQFAVNETRIDHKVMTVCVGNARGYGLTPSAVPYNGCLDVSVVSHPELTQLANGLWMLLTGRFLNHRNVKAHRTERALRFDDIHHAPVGIDGRYIGHVDGGFEIKLKPEFIQIIIP